MLILKLMMSAQAHINKILFNGKFSESSVKAALDVLKGYTAKIDAQVAKIKDSWGRKWIKEDKVDPKVYVESVAKAEGDNTVAQADVKIAMMKIDGASLTIGTATSYAAAEGGQTNVSAKTFSKATGIDFGTIKTYSAKGPNYEKAVEAIVLLDWDSVYDKNIIWKKHHKVHDRAKKDVGVGNVAEAKADVYVSSDDSATAASATKALALGGELSGASASGYASA